MTVKHIKHVPVETIDAGNGAFDGAIFRVSVDAAEVADALAGLTLTAGVMTID